VATGLVLGPDDLETDMTPLNRVELVNPFDIAFTEDGSPVVTDASENGVAARNPDGTTSFIHRFDQIPAPGNESLRIDAVPTGIARVGDEFYVTLTGGCPYPEGSGRLVAIDGQRGERTVVAGLNMPIDVARADDGTIWLLEFARFDPDGSCFTGEGYRPGTGRLSRVVDDRVEPVLEGLDFPGALAIAPDGSIYVSETFAGRVLRVTFDEPPDDASRQAAAPWRFTDVASDVGLDFRHGAFQTKVSTDPTAMMGGGLCWIDIDGDGWLDLYVVNSHAVSEIGYWEEQGGLPRNQLYRNVEGAFENVSDGSGADLAHRGMGCVAADFDGDGHTDLYVTADGPNALLMNDGDGRFAEVAAAAGVDTPGWSSAAAVGDVDGDGDLDLFVGSYIDTEKMIDKPSGAFPQDFLGIVNHLYLNDGSGQFEAVTREAGLSEEERTLGAVFSDIDGDGDLDLYVANDGHPNRLYENRAGDGSLGFEFVDMTIDAGVGDSGSGMGIAAGDFDEDGGMDLFVTNWDVEFHALYRNQRSGEDLTFDFVTYRVGLAGFGVGDTGWGATWGDFDNDTDLDLLVVNGRVPMEGTERDEELVRLFGNLFAEGKPGELRDWTERVELDGVGPLRARGSAVADFDNDGDLDVAVNQIGRDVVLLRNEGALSGWLSVEVKPAEPGTMVMVELTDGRVLTRELRIGGSYLASEDPRAHFGIDDREAVDVVVRWPDGTVERRTDVSANQRIVITR
ncbi:MAG: ScyD/ScyE family protein, partial [Acidimicrobiia bacterium]